MPLALETINYLLVLAIGLIIGSFLSVVIFRLPKEKTIIWGRSQCPYCHHTLQWIDLIPVFSFVLSAGRCRYCRHRISLAYPVIELTTAALFVLAYYVTLGTASQIDLGQYLTFIYLLILFSCFVALFYIDLFYLLLPDILVFFAFFTSIIYQLLIIILHYLGTYQNLHQSTTGLGEFLLGSHYPISYLADQLTPLSLGLLAGFVVATCFFLLIVATKGKGMGGGDVKFALVLGVVNGWPNIIVALFGAFISGAIVSLVLIALRKKKFTNTIAFGPFLITSSIVALVFGNWLVDFYMQRVLG